MKILIATGTLNKNLRAPDKLIAEIAPLLSAGDNQCIVAGICFDAPAETIHQGNMTFIRMHSSAFTDKALYNFEKFHSEMGGVDRNKSRKSFYIKHPFYSAGIFLKYFIKASYKRTVNSYIRQLSDIIKHEKPDRIIVSYMPTEFAVEVFKLETDCPKYAYQLDPWGLYEGGDSGLDDETRIKQECEMFSMSEAIFTTKQLFDQYTLHPQYIPYTNKMTVVEFPNITTPPEKSITPSVIDFDADYTNILFSGVIDDAYRSPYPFLSAIEDTMLNSDFPVRFYFLGTCTSNSLKDFAQKYPNNIILHDRVTPTQANATLQRADFLLNIGNTMTNQVPSKIFDYFSSGKPIINVQKIENCPAKIYFDKYPLCYTFEEFSSKCDGLTDFLLKEKKSSINFNEIRSIYATSTPEYVTDIILRTLS